MKVTWLCDCVIPTGAELSFGLGEQQPEGAVRTLSGRGESSVETKRLIYLYQQTTAQYTNDPENP